MINELFDPTTREERQKIAFNTALYDDEFHQYLAGAGCKKEAIERILSGVSLFLREDPGNCQGLKGWLKHELRRQRADVMKCAMKYRAELVRWIVEGDLPNAPNFLFQKLPPLDQKTLPQYLELFKKNKKELWNSELHDQARNIFDQHEDEGGRRDAMCKALRDFEGARANEVEVYGNKLFLSFNLISALEKFFNQDDNNALQGLLLIMKEGDSGVFESRMYDSLLSSIIKKLASNQHFVRTLLVLINEFLTQDKPDEKQVRIFANLKSGLLSSLVDALSLAGVWQPDVERVSVNVDKPRQFGTYPFKLPRPVDPWKMPSKHRNDCELRIPAQYLPPMWNEHRLVLPHINESLQAFAKILDSARETVDHNKAEETFRAHKEGLIHKRRYALDFSKIRVTEIPGTEGMEIWFHYFFHKPMLEGEIGIELVVDGASVVYYLDSECNLFMKSEGNVYPGTALRQDLIKGPRGGRARTGRLEANFDKKWLTTKSLAKAIINPKRIGTFLSQFAQEVRTNIKSLKGELNLDEMYQERFVRMWASPPVIDALHRYFIKYAHCLLVEERSQGEKGAKFSSADEDGDEFGLRLTEYTSQINLPSSGFDSDGNNKGNKITVYHSVAGHVRELPAGWRPSPGAVDEARSHSIYLAPGQTFVRPHHRGNEFAERTSPNIKIK